MRQARESSRKRKSERERRRREKRKGGGDHDDIGEGACSPLLSHLFLHNLEAEEEAEAFEMGTTSHYCAVLIVFTLIVTVRW